MPIELRPFGKDQLHEATQLTVKAFANNPFRQIAIPDNEGQAGYERFHRRLLNSMEHPDSHPVQLYDTGAGKMVAFAIWRLTQATSEQEWDRKSEERMESFPDGRQEMLRPFLKKESEAKKKVIGQHRWWELDALSVDLQYQRQGFGGRLMAWGIEESERRRLPSVIVTTQAGYGLYLKYGYEPRETWYADLTKGGGEGLYKNAILTRYPKDWGEADQSKWDQLLSE